jgi:hypothetical protein
LVGGFDTVTSSSWTIKRGIVETSAGTDRICAAGYSVTAV